MMTISLETGDLYEIPREREREHHSLKHLESKVLLEREAYYTHDPAHKTFETRGDRNLEKI